MVAAAGAGPCGPVQNYSLSVKLPAVPGDAFSGVSVRVEALAYFLAGLEIGNALGAHLHGFPRAWIAARPGIPCPRRESAKAPKLDPPPGGQAFDDFTEEKIDDLFHFLKR